MQTEDDPRDDRPGAADPAGGPTRRELEARIAELERRLAAAGTPPAPLELKALRVVAPEGWGAGWVLRPSPRRRNWMDGNPHAYHCLPLVIANQWGWQVLCPTDVRVTWDGSPGPDGLVVEADPAYAPAIKSQFGSGIVTFSPPWLFRTSTGWDLLTKGPGNRWKPNCVPLEGVVETWWLNYTFTINWKVVEPGVVDFAKGESLAQLVPVPHATFQGARARELPIALEEPKAAEELLRWREERRRIAPTADAVHKLYRRAEGIPDHLQHVPVPALEMQRLVGHDRKTDEEDLPRG
ncbi:hypothetical protein OJF2_04670 [Aquisphaera giovannonii]|uniref:Uncharacterized protein n=1 Tax=Aquisphaera giovannonii TaxID=406548 RepID=A0A5B9VUR6_9BACT|nr:DUF6065 family protein [Aquisphaera giovannonii]QEH31998.1 hypothetical protein OJF2_04670 [Aquisphaera giovannonii]